jgi:NAD(P)H-dependent flavin oxidoreductase YrpB (nitropropane dioxygenase family)
MTTFTDTFNCSYPIASMAMNKVSDLNLAVAVRKAGALPSLSVFNYFISQKEISAKLLQDDLNSYKEQTGDCSILISTGVDQLLDNSLFEVILNSKVKAIELILDTLNENKKTEERFVERNKRIAMLRRNGTLVFVKAIQFDDIIDGIDGIALKGPDGAGRGNTQGTTLSELFDYARSNFPNLKVIVAGGIGTSAQVKEYMDRGAFGVGIGTLFAACQESKISHETKLKMVEASASDIKKLTNGAKQNALIFKELEQDMYNNTRGLMTGIGNPNLGHVFAGTSIEHVTDVKPAEQVVQELAKDL